MAHCRRELRDSGRPTEGASRTRWDSMSAKDLPTLRQVEQEEEEAERAA
jgi:hypothetical protein